MGHVSGRRAQGGHPEKQVARHISANPNGNREERRAAKQLGVPGAQPASMSTRQTDGCTCDTQPSPFAAAICPVQPYRQRNV